MVSGLTGFLIHWAVLTFVLWVASHVFKGIKYFVADGDEIKFLKEAGLYVEAP